MWLVALYPTRQYYHLILSDGRGVAAWVAMRLQVKTVVGHRCNCEP
jgi:hypothetical protein